MNLKIVSSMGAPWSPLGLLTFIPIINNLSNGQNLAQGVRHLRTL